MLFNSYIFLLAFLPLTLLVYHGLRRSNHSAIPALFWLVIMSLFYYAWWNPVYLLLLGASMLINYQLGLWLGNPGRPIKKHLLWVGVAGNLFALGYFKYANFFFDSLSSMTGADHYLAPIVLPLAISFFTFQQIAYLVDSYRGYVRETNVLRYSLFVCFFPQLLSGPIVHHKEMMPQFAALGTQAIDRRLLEQGLTLFAIGLFKKVVLADTFGLYADPVFAAAEAGSTLSGLDVTLGTLAFALQIYFDFSGYSDIALGTAAMFGIRLVFNFDSPYQSGNIIEFWRRWHMSLSRFLRDYLYFTLGGNRNGPLRRHCNLLITMLLGGLWHGAGWNFILWGCLQGAYLIVNHSWRHLLSRQKLNFDAFLVYRLTSWLLCFSGVLLAWIFFRAESLVGASHMLQALVSQGWWELNAQHHIPLSRTGFSPVLGLLDSAISKMGAEYLLLILGLAIVTLLPNSQTVVGLEHATRRPLSGHVRWRASYFWAVATGLMVAISVLALGQTTQFVYFQF